MSNTVLTITGEWLQDDRDYTVRETLAICRIDSGTFDDYIAHGVIDVEHMENLAINYAQICTVSKAARLQRELELSVHAVALMIQLLDRIDEQQRELAKFSSISADYS